MHCTLARGAVGSKFSTRVCENLRNFARPLSVGDTMDRRWCRGKKCSNAERRLVTVNREKSGAWWRQWCAHVCKKAGTCKIAIPFREGENWGELHNGLNRIAAWSGIALKDSVVPSMKSYSSLDCLDPIIPALLLSPRVRSVIMRNKIFRARVASLFTFFFFFLRRRALRQRCSRDKCVLAYLHPWVRKLVYLECFVL